MPTTDNGWSASPDLAIRPLVVAGESFSPGIRDDDDVYTVLQYVAEQMHARVEPIVRDDWHQADDWGFSYRPNRNSPNSLSRHSGGIAIDYNATRHPNGVPTANTYSAVEIHVIHQILAEVDDVVRWGGDYHGTPDAMHFEIDTPPHSAALARVAERIREGNDPMADYAKQLDRIEKNSAAALKATEQLAAAEKRRSQANIARIQRVVKKVTGVEASAERIEKALSEEPE